MVTYVNDLRLSELATGEGSGTWGTTTNTNLELIGEALGYATEQSFGSDADATTTVGDGVSDPARAMYFKVTSAGNLTATRTLTIAPNTVSRVMFIENATSGSQSIAISQGSGANVTIATGKTAIVYLDGAGSGAAVVDAMAGVDPGVTDTLAEVLTAGNATGGTDIAVGTGDDVTFADSSKAIFGAGSDLQIYHDGSNSYITEQGTGQLLISTNGTTIDLLASGAEYMARFIQNGQSEIYYDSAKKLETTSTGIDVTGSVVSDGLTVDGASKLKAGSTSTPADTAAFISNASAKLVVNHGNEYGAYVGYANSSNDAIGIQSTTSGGTTAPLSLNPYGGDVGIGTNSPNSYLAEGSNLVVADSGHAGITLASGTTSEGGIFFADGTSGSDRFRGMIRYNHTSNYMEFRTDAGERMRIDSSGHLLVGTSTVGYAGVDLIVGDTADSQNGIGIQTSTTGYGYILFGDGTGASAYTGQITYKHDDNYMAFNTTGTERMRVDNLGDLTIKGGRIFVNESDNGNTAVAITRDADEGYVNVYSSGTQKIEIRGNGDSYFNGGNFGIGTTSPASLLQLLGSPVATSGALGTFRNSDATSSNTTFGGILFNSSPGTDYSIGKSNVNAATTLSFRNGNTGASFMDIDSSGKVGIGTSSPAVALDVQAASGASRINVGTGSVAGNHGVNVVSGGSDNDYGVFFNGSIALGSNTTTGTQLKIGSNGSETTFQTLTFHTNADERMRIDSGGRVLINTSSGSYTHDKGLRVVTSEVGSHALDSAVNLQGSGGDFYPLSITGPSDVGFGKLAVFSASTDSLYWQYRSGGSSTFLTRVDADGDFHVYGAISKNSGSFRIDHPLPEKTATHDLVHSFIEGPQADNIYRGAVDLVDGSATVNIDTAAGMTEGTYVALNTNTQCFTSNESGWTAVKGSVSGNTLTITAQENTCTDTVSWMVVGERKDPHMIAAKWTDENGKVIVEPLKENN